MTRYVNWNVDEGDKVVIGVVLFEKFDPTGRAMESLMWWNATNTAFSAGINVLKATSAYVLFPSQNCSRAARNKGTARR